MTGSSLPSRALRVRSVANSLRTESLWPVGWSKAGRPANTGDWPTRSLSAERTWSPETPRRASTSMAVPLPSRTMPRSRCSVEM